MATYLHRAYDPVATKFVYWTAKELDLAGAFWVGPPVFSALENPVLLRKILGGSAAYHHEEVHPVPLITIEEVP